VTYDTERTQYSREHIYVVELHLDFCSLTYGEAPCTASGPAELKCYNTQESTQDLPNYTQEIKIYRFCTARSPHPIGIDAIPNLLSVALSPSKIDLKGGLGIRSSVSLRFRDHPGDDLGIDKYLDERDYIASDQGTFWTKLRARNPNYENRILKVWSGYLVNGEFDESNFQARHYLIDSMNVTKGMCTIIAKDPLKAVGKFKNKAPLITTGTLVSDINQNQTSITLEPAGVGDLEYLASGFILIEKEVCSFTRVADVFTIVRGTLGTEAIGHSTGDTVQQCLEFVSKQVHEIVFDLLTIHGGIDPAFIPFAAWQAEADTFLSGFLSGIIVKPFDVNKLLVELTESMPHYLWWDERTQFIQFTALKAPPISATPLNMDSHLVEGTVRVKDMPQLRASTIFVNFGISNVSESLTEIGNFQQAIARVDTESIAKHGLNRIKTVNSRWISSLNKAAALQLAALIGRRFANISRLINFTLDAKDSDVWAGQSRSIIHRDIVGFDGLPLETVFQILSVRERDNGTFDYEALEFTYGDSLPEDEGGGDPGVDLVIFGADLLDGNLRTVYDTLFPAPDASTVVKFIVENGVKLGSTSTGSPGLDTGTWPAGATVTLQLNIGGIVAGQGGTGAAAISSGNNGSPGGLGLTLSNDLELINNGVVGGGGGGGASDFAFLGPGPPGSNEVGAAGGGGAGHLGGSGGSGHVFGESVFGQDGSALTGGSGVNTDFVQGGQGGDLGQAGLPGSGSFAGGAPGNAIDKNGFTMTETTLGDIRGTVTA